VLLPVTWLDGWPIIGRPGRDGIGEMVWGGAKPILSKSTSELFVSDSLRERSLRPAWEWRYQPKPNAWSLGDGGLRLRALMPLAGRAGFAAVRNVLTQRAARTAKAEVTVTMNLAGLVDGQEAGLAHFAKANCRLAAIQNQGVRTLMRMDQPTSPVIPIPNVKRVWFRSTWGMEGVARFSYSFDGLAFTGIGDSCPLSWGSYRGDRVGLYTVNRTGDRGFVEFSDFRYRME
jgi:beta-xylosidase